MGRWSVCIAFLALPGFAQTESSSYGGQTWVGLLVADTCHVKIASPATAEAEMTLGSRTTTPAVDRSGTRGQSTALDPTAKPPADSKRSIPYVGPIDSKLPTGLNDPGWDAARKQARKLHGECRIRSDSSRFLLVLPDGLALPLDDLANAGVRMQLPALPEGGNIFRVQITGKLQNGKIGLNNIRI